MRRGDFIHLKGKTFGFWTVTSQWERRIGASGTRRIFWLCRCQCGKHKWVHSTALTRKTSRSCGCMKGYLISIDKKKSVRDINHPLYGLWNGIKQRCSNPNATSYETYGQLGGKMCDRWRKDFWAFVEDMGPRPSLNHSIDRYPDRHGEYSPDNCRWATSKQQAENRDDTFYVTVDSIYDSIPATCLRLGVSPHAFRLWLSRGIDPQRIADEIRKAKGPNNKLRPGALRPVLSLLTHNNLI
jgi:hypothetical protein